MKHTTIAERFHHYLTTVFDEDQVPQKGTVPYQELQRAFFAAYYDGCYNTLKACEQMNFTSPERWLREGIAFGQLTGDGEIPTVTQ
jgi:hypothetical protein